MNIEILDITVSDTIASNMNHKGQLQIEKRLVVVPLGDKL